MRTPTDALAAKFAQLSADRDKPVESETQATGYETSEGYVHEVVSRSPNRQTVTKRVTITQCDPDGSQAKFSTAPRLSYSTPPSGSSSVVAPSETEMSPSAAAFDQRQRPIPRDGFRSPSYAGSTVSISADGTRRSSPCPSVVYGAATVTPLQPSQQRLEPTAAFQPVVGTQWRPAAPQPGREDFPKPREVEAFGTMRWVTTTPSRRECEQDRAVLSPNSAPFSNDRSSRPLSAIRTGFSHANTGARSVTIGGVNTTFVEPSRVSPVQVRELYAPVKYLSKREWRAMRRQLEGHNGMQDGRGGPVRHGSVPRLDSYLQEQLLMQQHSGREFNPQSTGLRSAERRSSASRRTPSANRRADPPPPFDGVYHQSPKPHQPYPPPQYEQVEYDDFEEEDAEDMQWDSVSQRSAPQYYTEPAQHDVLRMGVLLAPGTAQQRFYSASSRYSATDGLRSPHAALSYVTTVDHLPDAVHVTDFAQRVAFCRGLDRVPQPPPQCNDAFRLLYRGTYVVKYGRQGLPHERFMALRLVETEVHHTTQPFLVWSTHAESASFKERLHLALLCNVVLGPLSGNFQRHLVGRDAICGPTLGGKKTTLPTTYAFSLVFQSNSGVSRTVDCLCMDDQTYHCWLMVAQYLADINTNVDANSHAADAETIVPDSPRSGSAASQPARRYYS